MTNPGSANDSDQSDCAKEDYDRQADEMAWGFRGPSASYAEWLAEGKADDDRPRCVQCASALCPSCGGCWCLSNRCHELGDDTAWWPEDPDEVAGGPEHEPYNPIGN